MKKVMMAAALVAGSVSLTAQADALNQKNLSLAQANALATSAIQACVAKNYQVTVTWWTAPVWSKRCSVPTMPGHTR